MFNCVKSAYWCVPSTQYAEVRMRKKCARVRNCVKCVKGAYIYAFTHLRTFTHFSLSLCSYGENETLCNRRLLFV